MGGIWRCGGAWESVGDMRGGSTGDRDMGDMFGDTGDMGGTRGEAWGICLGTWGIWGGAWGIGT